MSKAQRPALGDLVGNIGRAGLALLQAEARGIQRDLALSGRLALRSGIWGMLAAALCFWGAAVLTAAAVVAISAWLSLLQSLLAVGALFLLLGVIAALLARSHLRSLELPTEALKRRANDHLSWWQAELAASTPKPPRRSEEGDEQDPS